MPGVSVTTATRSGPAAVDRAPGSTFFVAGLTERGRVDQAVLVRSLADFETTFGARVSYGFLHDAIRTFFAEGGTKAYVVRVVGPAATTGGVDLMDRSTTVAVATLRLTARGPGAWSGGVSATVADNATTGTFSITLTDGRVTESFTGLGTVADAVAAINARSTLVSATDLGSAGNDPRPAAGTTTLTAGNDDRAAVVAADYVTALDNRAPTTLGAGAVAVPGMPSSSVGAGLIAHARTNRRIALLAAASGATSTDAVNAAQALRGSQGSEGAGLFYPWVTIPDGTTTRTIPPEAFVAGARARAHETEGPWRAPGGEISVARFVSGVATELGRAAGDDLDALEVNAIRVIAGSPRLYGWRSLSADEANYALLTGRDVINDLVIDAERRLEQFVFRTIDARRRLLGEVEAEVIGMVEPIRLAGGLYELIGEDGEVIDPGYLVNTGAAVNTAETLARNEIHVEVGVRISPSGTLIRVLITKVGLTAAL